MPDDKATSGYQPTGLRDPITEYSLLLVGHDGDRTYPAGTAVFIGPQLAITAKHVVMGIRREFDPRPEPKGARPVELRFGIEAVQFLNGEPAFWRVERMVGSTGTDIAFLHVTPACPKASAHTFRGFPRLSSIPPRVGERVASFGYPGSSGDLAHEGDTRRFDLYLSPSTTFGEVVTVHEEKRDAGMFSFPCFETSGNLEGGMSGGPAFNQQGALCGLNCGSAWSGSGAPVAIYTLLWPGLVTALDFKLPGIDLINPRYGAYELARVGFLTWDGWDTYGPRIVVESDPDGVSRVRLRPS